MLYKQQHGVELFLTEFQTQTQLNSFDKFLEECLYKVGMKI